MIKRYYTRCFPMHTVISYGYNTLNNGILINTARFGKKITITVNVRKHKTFVNTYKLKSNHGGITQQNDKWTQ